MLLPLAALVMPTTLLLLAGLIPTVVAFIIDRDPDKSAPLTVGAMNFCGIMPFCIKLWQGGHTIDLTLRLLSQPGNWLVMYGAAAFGWLLYYGIPPLVVNAMVMREQQKIRELEQARAALVADWGPEIAGSSDEAEAEAKPGAGGPKSRSAATAADSDDEPTAGDAPQAA